MEKEEGIKKVKDTIIKFFPVLSLIQWLISLTTPSIGTTVMVVIIMPSRWIIALLLGTIVWGVLFFLSVLVMHWYNVNIVAGKKDKEKQKEALLSTIEITKGSVNKASTFDARVIQKYQSWSADFYIPRKVRKKLLPELIKCIRDYFKWFDEAWDIISMKRKLAFQESKFKALGDRFDKFELGYFDRTFVDSNIELSTLKGTIDFTACREYILQRYGRDCKTADGTDSLREFVDSQGFHDFVDLYENLQMRPSVEEFREQRKCTLKIIEQIEVELKTKSRKGASYNE